jgi:hypothetical protein
MNPRESDKSCGVQTSEIPGVEWLLFRDTIMSLLDLLTRCMVEQV